MKYIHALTRLKGENSRVVFLNYTLSFVLLIMGLALCILGLRKPLLIERGCSTKATAYGTLEQADSELESFLLEALTARFNSYFEVFNSDLLSIEQIIKRKSDFEELKKRKIKQRLFFNQIVSKDGHGYFTIEADRILSIEEIRTAFRYPLKVQIAKVPRSTKNPYGLILLKAFSPKKKKNKKGGK